MNKNAESDSAKLIKKIPKKITHPPENKDGIKYKSETYKNYKFFMPKEFVKKRGKESEYEQAEI